MFYIYTIYMIGFVLYTYMIWYVIYFYIIGYALYIYMIGYVMYIYMKGYVMYLYIIGNVIYIYMIGYVKYMIWYVIYIYIPKQKWCDMFYIYIYMIVHLVGGFNPFYKYRSQLGWCHSRYMGKMFQTTNQLNVYMDICMCICI